MTTEKKKNYVIDRIRIGKKKYQKRSSHDGILGGIFAFGFTGVKINVTHRGMYRPVRRARVYA